MASTYTEGLVIELIGSGDKAGSWGDVTNNNLKSLNQGITGFSEVDLSGAGTSYTIDLSDAQVPDESTSPSRSSIIKFINVPDSHVTKLAGNSVPVNMIRAVDAKMKAALDSAPLPSDVKIMAGNGQLTLQEG